MQRIAENIEKLLNWLGSPAPMFFNVLFFVGILGTIAGVLGGLTYLIIYLLGWHVLTVLFCAGLLTAVVYLTTVQTTFEGGISEWWKDRPWNVPEE